MKAILTYHSIDDTGSPISVSPMTWAAHIRWLSSGRVRVLDLDELIALPDAGPDAIAVTFDDGFQNVGPAAEALRASGLPVTLFVVTHHVGGTNEWGGRRQSGIPTLPLLGWGDLERLVARGVSIQAHTRTHPSLTKVPGAQLDDELDGCREDLHARLGLRSTHLAYPYGDCSDAIVERAARSFRVGHTTEFRAIGPGEQALRMPRLDMYYFRTPGRLESWGQPAFTRRLAWVRARRTVRALLKR